MTYLIISEQRFLHHLDYDVRKHARGVFNWYVEDNVFNGLLHIQGVDYIYQAPLPLHPDVELALQLDNTASNMILGYYEPEDTNKEEEVQDVRVISELNGKPIQLDSGEIKW